jgi:uncharacterized protein (TIGR02246 family)
MSDEQAVRGLLRQWAEAHKQVDIAALKELYAEDWVYTDFTGTVWDKARYLASFTPDFTCEFWDSDDTQVRTYGDVAVLTSLETMKGVDQGYDYSGQYRITLIFIKRKGHWEMVAGQGTRIAQQ